MTTTTAEKIAIMQAFERGEKIESSTRFPDDFWKRDYIPTWDWDHLMYRVTVPEPIPHTIDWNHVSNKFDILMTNEKGEHVLAHSVPGSIQIVEIPANAFQSFKAGNMKQFESMVLRPTYNEDSSEQVCSRINIVSKDDAVSLDGRVEHALSGVACGAP